jgi:hypothetical protein
MVLCPVRPGERHVVEAVEVQVTVLVPAGVAPVGVREFCGRLAVHERHPRARLEAVSVGELAVQATGEVIAPTGLRASRALGCRVLADARARVTRPLTGGGRPFGPAYAGVEDVRVAVGLAARVGVADRILVGHRVADFGVADLLLHQHAALERGPRDLVLLLGGVVLRVERKRGARAVGDVRVHEAVRRAGGHEPGPMGGQILDHGGEPLRRVRDRDDERIPRG